MTWDSGSRRLNNALARVRDLEQRALDGEVIPPAALVGEVRAIRDDLLVERQERLAWRDEAQRLLSEKLPRKPWGTIAAWIAGILATVNAAVIVLLITKGLVP